MSFDDPFGELEEAEKAAKKQKSTPKKAAPKRKSRSKTPKFDQALGDVRSVDVARAAKKSTVQGKYWLRTLRLPPEYQELTRQIFQEEVRAKSLAEIERWIYTMGLVAYFEEGKRPDYSESISRAINLPDVGEGPDGPEF